MTKKKQNKNNKGYSKEDATHAEAIVGNEMNDCSGEICDVLMKYEFSPAMMCGVLMSIILTIANDIYSTLPPEDTHICTDCKETIHIKEKSSLKKVKEAEASMYG